MQLEQDVLLLQKLPLFAGMDPEYLGMIAFSAERLLFRAGDLVAVDGQLGEAAYVVLSGSAQIVEGTGDKRRIHLISPGAMIGELAMLVEFTFASTVMAVDEMQVLELRRDMIHEMMWQFPPIMEHFSRRIHSRLAKMAEDLRRYDRPTGAPTGGESKGLV